jgi:hypothetical protein
MSLSDLCSFVAIVLSLLALAARQRITPLEIKISEAVPPLPARLPPPVSWLTIADLRKLAAGKQVGNVVLEMTAEMELAEHFAAVDRGDI